MELKRIITFTNGSRKKIKNQNMRIELKNIISSIWIEWWNWKLIRLLQKKSRKKIRNSKNEDHIREYNIW